MSLTGVAAAQVGLNLFAKIADAAVAGTGKEKSLVAATKGARFEPRVLVDSDVSTYEGITDIMYSLQSLFTGYLLQAISLYGNVGGTRAISELDRFNPTRTPDFTGFAKSVVGIENYQHRLPTPQGSVSLEEFDGNSRRYSKAYKVAVENSLSIGKDSDIEKNLVQSANLSVGKVYNVDFTAQNGIKINVPITVRLLSIVVPSERLTHILTLDASKLTDLKERFYAWKAGRLSTSDLLTAKDLVRLHRKELMNDKDGLYSDIMQRRSTNNMAAMTSGKASMAAASNMVVMSTETARAIEQKMNMKFSNYLARDKFINGGDNLRDKITQGSSLMLIAIVDKFADRVTFYTEGISESTNLSLREIKAAGKSSGGPDVSEILKAYQLGMSPSTL